MGTYRKQALREGEEWEVSYPDPRDVWGAAAAEK